MQVLTSIAATLVLVYNAITLMFTFNSWTQWVTDPIPIYVRYVPHLHLKFAYVLSTHDMPHPKSYCSNVFEEGIAKSNWNDNFQSIYSQHIASLRFDVIGLSCDVWFTPKCKVQIHI